MTTFRLPGSPRSVPAPSLSSHPFCPPRPQSSIAAFSPLLDRHEIFLSALIATATATATATPSCMLYQLERARVPLRDAVARALRARVPPPVRHETTRSPPAAPAPPDQPRVSRSLLESLRNEAGPTLAETSCGGYTRTVASLIRRFSDGGG